MIRASALSNSSVKVKRLFLDMALFPPGRGNLDFRFSRFSCTVLQAIDPGDDNNIIPEFYSFQVKFARRAGCIICPPTGDGKG